MSHKIYKLRFPSGIHIGSANGLSLESTSLSMRSDTFYSALYTEYMRLYNDEEFIQITQKGRFLISDLFPFKDDKLYIPKPFFVFNEQNQNVDMSEYKKKLKAINYIPVNQLKEYIDFLKKGENFPQIDNDFGIKQLDTKNQVSRIGDDNLLYNIETFRFYNKIEQKNEKEDNKENESGLYFIAILDENFIERFELVLESLSLTGIGGKKSSGIGKFDICSKENNENLIGYKDIEELLVENSSAENHYKKYLVLSSYLPEDSEIKKLKEKGNGYKLIKRSGFVNSPSYSDQPQKRKQVYMLSSGSVLNFKPEGEIVDLNLHGNHRIYRMGKPIVMGVDLWEQ